MDGMKKEAQDAPPAIDPEVLKAMKAARRASYYGIRPGTTGHGTPEAFEDDAVPPKFMYEMMTGTDMQDFYDLFYVDGILIKGKQPETIKWILDRKLTGWIKFQDRDGKEIPFERTAEGLTPETWASIPIPLRSDLFSMILGANQVSPKEAQGLKH